LCSGIERRILLNIIKISYWVGSKDTRVKDGSASYLLWVKYAWVGSEPISSLEFKKSVKNSTEDKKISLPCHFLFQSSKPSPLFFDPGRVSHLWFGFWKFPLKIPIFSVFSLPVKKISSGWVKKPGSKMGRPLFSAGQKDVWFGSSWVMAHL